MGPESWDSVERVIAEWSDSDDSEAVPPLPGVIAEMAACTEDARPCKVWSWSLGTM